MSTPFSSQLSKLQVMISSVFTDIPRVVGIKIPPTDPAYDDITSLESAGGYPERLPVGKNFVDVPHEIIWDPDNAVHIFLQAASIAQTECNFKAIVSNAGAAHYTYSAFVKWEPSLDPRKAGRVNMTLNVTGAVTPG